jgi:predicted CopG family antitoxin
MTKKHKSKKVMISVYDDIWSVFVKNCKNEYKSASGVIRELIMGWNNASKKRKENE